MKHIKKIILSIAKQLDKLALAFVLIFFIMNILNFIEILKENNNKFNKLSLKTSFNSYTPINDNSYNADNFFIKQTSLWDKSVKRNNDKNSPDYISAYTDFMQPFKIARSIANEANNQLIPYQNYLLGICPITNEPLPIPNTDQLSIYTSNYDYDQDGIPDVMEKKYGLNPESPIDAWYDSDNDSFPNIIDYKYNKEGISSPNIHPPLIQRIVLDKIANTSIPILMKGLIKNGYNKNNWRIQVNLKTSKGWETKFLKIGDQFEVNDIKYTIKDIDEDYEPVLNPNLGVIQEVDKSIIVLKDSLGQNLEAIMEKPVYEPSRRIILKDLYTGKPIITKINNEIEIGNNNSEIDKYKLIEIGNNNRTLIFENPKTKEQFTVSNKTSYRKPINSK